MTMKFDELIQQYSSDSGIKNRIAEEIRGHIDEFIEGNQLFTPFARKLTIILHGSTVRNIYDNCSDIDFLILFDDVELTMFDSISDHRYISYDLNGKPGHFNPMSIVELQSCFSKIDMAMIHDIRDAMIIVDRKNIFQGIQKTALQAMPDDVQYAFFFRNYVEMRSCHRALDNPMEREDEIAVLMGITKTITYALRSALILDKIPYPLDKWLHVVSHYYPTAKSILPYVNNILFQLKTDSNCLRGSEASNQISKNLREMRAKLILKSNEIGITDLWLEKWYRYIDPSKAAIENVKWTNE
jgi:predicted nucleotidyltransferase